MPLLSGIWGRGREQFHFIRFMSTPFWVSSNRDSWRNMLLPSRAATLWLWHCGAPKANEMIHVVRRARGGKRDRMRDPVMCPSPAPTANCLLFQYWELDCAKLHPCSQVLPSLCTGNFIQSQLVQWACLRVRLGSGAVGFCYQPHTYYAVRTFPPISTKTRARLLLSHGSLCCTVSSLFEAFCVLPVRSTFCKSLARTSVLSSWLKHFRKPDERNGAQGKL